MIKLCQNLTIWALILTALATVVLKALPPQ